MKVCMTLTVVAILCMVSVAFASQNRFQQFNTDVQNAYTNYRIALFQTNKNDGKKSQIAVQQFQQDWDLIIETYGIVPPEVFSTDPQWKITLKSINDIAKKSADQIEKNELDKAHETLEGIRDELSNLRHRNSVVVFSDHVNNYHEVMEGLLLAGYSPENLDAEAVDHIRGELAVLKYLAKQIKENAPPQYGENVKYQQLIQELSGSLEKLEMAVKDNTPEKISNAVKGLKPAYSKLFVNFG